jgi:uncharacterized protein YbjT (DUF2867 family)
MTILVTGTVGRHVVDNLAKRGADMRALVGDLAKAALPNGAGLVEGDLLDVDALRSAFSGVSTLFLLNAMVPDEFTHHRTFSLLQRDVRSDAERRHTSCAFRLTTGCF